MNPALRIHGIALAAIWLCLLSSYAPAQPWDPGITFVAQDGHIRVGRINHFVLGLNKQSTHRYLYLNALASLQLHWGWILQNNGRQVRVNLFPDPVLYWSAAATGSGPFFSRWADFEPPLSRVDRTLPSSKTISLFLPQSRSLVGLKFYAQAIGWEVGSAGWEPVTTGVPTPYQVER